MFRASLAGLGLAILLAAGLTAAGATAAEILRRVQPVPGLAAEIAPDGTLLLRTATADEPVLVSSFEVAPGRRRPGQIPVPHVARAHEGGPAGQRGFSDQADDDRDGRLNEDPLDGRDNDGDGLIDEDYAAIGDHMLVIDLGPVTGRIEYYSWAHPHLQSTIFAAPSAGSDALGPVTWQLLTSGSDWIETDVRGLHHRVTGRCDVRTTHAYVAHVDAKPGAAAVWLGVAVLNEPATDGTGRTILDHRRLSIPLGAEPTAVAVVAADTWLGLVRRLTEAAVVRAGVTDPVSGRSVPWVVPPPCAGCRTAETPDFLWNINRQGHLTLTARLADGSAAQIDPDRFRIDNLALGSPDQILWQAADADEVGIGWYAMTPNRLARTGIGLADPYAALGSLKEHRAAGTINYRFRTPSSAVLGCLTGKRSGNSVVTLEAGMVNGHDVTRTLDPDLSATDPVRSALTLALAGTPVAPGNPGDQERLLRSEQARPTLAPDLLRGWPNPFRDVISLRLRIPVTVGEAFVWDKNGGTPAGLDSEAPVPWSGGKPTVSVKIYSLSGRELRTLHEGSYMTGEVTVYWDGTDAFGRKVASGTYFCKLQMDDWSTTRRVVFMR